MPRVALHTGVYPCLGPVRYREEEKHCLPACHRRRLPLPDLQAVKSRSPELLCGQRVDPLDDPVSVRHPHRGNPGFGAELVVDDALCRVSG